MSAEQRITETMRTCGWLALAWIAASNSAIAQTAELPPAAVAPATPDAAARQSLADLVGRLIEGAIPTEYDKQKDWGATKEVPVGVRIEGKFLHTHVHKRTKAVDHGVWKHYKLRLVEPEKNLVVRVTALHPSEPGKVAATLEIEAKFDAWARARVYQYGVHVISIEMEADARVRLVIDGELAVRWNSAAWLGTVAIDPTAQSARLELTEFRIRRVSDAKGPLVRELSGGVRKLIEEELDGPQLTAKVNRAIEKKRDRLTLSTRELLDGAWRPLADFAATVAPAPAPPK